MKNRYTLSELVKIAYSLFITKLFYPKARLIRRPFYIRGKKSFKYGKGFTTGYGCRFDLDGEKQTLFIGDNCQIGDHVHMVALERVELGNGCLLASKIFISDTNHGTYDNTDPNSRPDVPPNERKLVTKPVKIGNNVWIGDNVVILSGVEIGDGCIIGANSVVTHNVRENSIVAGSPARYLKQWDVTEKKWVKTSEVDNGME